MKSNIEKVYSKLPKTELAKVELEKVELGLVDDLKKRYSLLSKDVNQLLEAQNEYFKIQRGMKTLLGVLENSIKAQSKDVEKAISAAKELGIDSKQFFTYEKQVQEIEQEIKDISKKIS